ncbi:MAG: PfkB family carbohydrate kinase [Scrofimicrobium sp.]
MRVLGFGDNVIDDFVDRRVQYPGGNAVNVAVFTHELGADSSYLGVFGNDELADYLKQSLVKAGVPFDHSVTKVGDTGWAAVQVVDGDRVFREANDGGVTVSDPFVLDDATVEWIVNEFDLVHSAVYAAVAGELSKIADSNLLLTYDFSEEAEFRTDEELAKVCPFIELALFSGAEGGREELVKTLMRAVEAGASMALGTLGAEGAILWDGTALLEESAHEPDGPIVDSMGCGDAFVSAFIMSLLADGWVKQLRPTSAQLSDALIRGSEFATKQLTKEGAFMNGRSY